MKLIYLTYLLLSLAYPNGLSTERPSGATFSEEISYFHRDQKKQKKDSVKTEEQEIQIPTTPISSFQGTVEVSFKIQEDGTINILNISADNPELIRYVVSKLEKIKLDPSYKDLGKTIKYRFEFKKEA